MAFVDLEKVFDHISREVIWWALRRLGVEEWIVQLVQGMYTYANGFFHPTLTYNGFFFLLTTVFIYLSIYFTKSFQKSLNTLRCNFT